MSVMTEAQKRKMIKELKGASRLHAAQAKRLEKTLEKAPKKKK
jgi:hypothetical protein|tara:strand:+ start:899 stop:1027 length:129 start_codon:yes stop_codon:yes gene_type:complete